MSIPDVFRVCNKYQSVFYGVLKDSKIPEADLEELGLKKEYALLAGTHYFMGKYPINIKDPGFREEINSKVSPFKVAMFYLRHPVRYIQKLEVTANKSFKLILRFGNYEKSHDSAPKKEVSSFRVWSDFKDNILPHSLWFLFLFFYGLFGNTDFSIQKSLWNIGENIFCYFSAGNDYRNHSIHYTCDMRWRG